jgi:hypothetical protein
MAVRIFEVARCVTQPITSSRFSASRQGCELPLGYYVTNHPASRVAQPLANPEHPTVACSTPRSRDVIGSYHCPCILSRA